MAAERSVGGDDQIAPEGHLPGKTKEPAARRHGNGCIAHSKSARLVWKHRGAHVQAACSECRGALIGVGAKQVEVVGAGLDDVGAGHAGNHPLDGLRKGVPTHGEGARTAHAAGRQVHVPAQYGICSTAAVKVCDVRNDADRIGNRRRLLEDASVQHQSSRTQCEGVRNGQNGILVEEDHRSGGQVVSIRESQIAEVSIHIGQTSGGIGCDDRSNLHVRGAGEHVFINPATQLQVALCTTAAETVDRSGRGGSVEDGGRGQCVGAARTEHRVKVEGEGGIAHTGGILRGSQPHLAAAQRAHVQGLGVGVGVQREHPGIVARAFENDLAGARRTAEEERGRCKISRKADAAQSLAIGENRDRVGRHVAGIG